MENINEIMKDFKTQLNKGKIQKAYRFIFDIFSDLNNELKKNQLKQLAVNSLYHGYLDMTYLPVTTGILKRNGLKIAIVFSYTTFNFEIWLSAINRNKRKEILELIKTSKWNKYPVVVHDENTDAIIEIKIKGIDDFGKNVVALLKKETLLFIGNVEKFVENNVNGK